jgi:TolB-like protein/DNA-binding winged helix-turn-helix (wHTH) protein/Tfp pilus assembly protein PilF
MPPTTPSIQTFRFGLFELDVRGGELRKRGLRVPLQGIPIQLLTILLENSGQVVTREDLRTRLWPADTFVDFDHSLHNAIARLREALGEDATNPRFIETLPRRGYRFLVPLSSSASSQTTPQQAVPPRRRRLVASAVLALTVLAALLIGINSPAFRSRLFGNASSSRIQSIAVLPLKNLSNDPEQDYFADGITEAVITDLGKVGALRVISRTSVMRYKDTRKPLPEIAGELQVDVLVEGTVARSGNHVRITANLVQASPERHLWAESYERDLRDVITLQNDVANAIAREIQVNLTPQERSRLATSRTVNPEAYQLYLKGRYFWNRRTQEGLKKAIDYFNQAIALDPNYALAYSGVADCYPPLAYLGYVPPNEALSRAKAAAAKALEIDESLAEAHAALGAEKMFQEWDWIGSEKEFKRAIELNPGYATAHSWYAQDLLAMGRFREGLEESKRAQQLDPFSLIINAGLAHRLYWARQYDQAIEQSQKTIELDPNFALAHWDLGLEYEQTGAPGQAIAEMTKAVSLSESNSLMMAGLGHAYAVSGNRAAALKIARDLEKRSHMEYVDPYAIALVYAGLAGKNQAFDYLEKAYEQRSPLFSFLNVEQMLDPIRSDPRFQQLVHRVGLPP